MSVLFGELSDLVVGSRAGVLVLPSLCGPVFLGVGEFPAGFVEFVAELFVGPLLFLGVEVGLGPGAIDFVLLGVEFCLEGVEVVGELVDPGVVGVAVPLEGGGEGVVPPVEFLVLGSVLVLLLVQLVLEGVDFSPEGQLPLLLLHLLLLLISDQVLDLLVLVSQQPVQVIDLVYQRFYFVVVPCYQLGGVSPLQIFVLDLDVDHL